MKKTWLIVIGIVLISGIYLVSSYNQLVTLREQSNNQWAQVETQYQRRLDLIPNLVESTKGVLRQEQEVFEAIADARTRYDGAQTLDDKTQAISELESSLSRLLLIVENYPELKSNETVNRLMDELAGTENRISVERKRFNDQVTTYNLGVMRFPNSLFANIYGFRQMSLFEAAPQADTPPAVNLDLE